VALEIDEEAALPEIGDYVQEKTTKSAATDLFKSAQ
jgi:hypothetical protein